jgi:hypothetical protein
VVATGVGTGQADGGRVDVEPPHLGARDGLGNGAGHRSRSAGDIHGDPRGAAPAECFHGGAGQQLTRAAGDEHPGTDSKSEPGERHPAADQRHGLAARPALDVLVVPDLGSFGHPGIRVEIVGIDTQHQTEEVRGVLAGDGRPPVVDGMRGA